MINPRSGRNLDHQFAPLNPWLWCHERRFPAPTPPVVDGAPRGEATKEHGQATDAGDTWLAECEDVTIQKSYSGNGYHIRLPYKNKKMTAMHIRINWINIMEQYVHKCKSMSENQQI